MNSNTNLWFSNHVSFQYLQNGINTPQHTFFCRSSTAHVLAEFSRKALSQKLPNDLVAPPSKAVIGNFSYICRQLYTTCEGLLVMNHYDLHSSIAAAWRQVCIESCVMAFSHSPPILADSFGFSETSKCLCAIHLNTYCVHCSSSNIILYTVIPKFVGV